MKISIRDIVLSALCLSALTLGILSYLRSSSVAKVAYVRSKELIAGYQGMKDAETLHTKKLTEWQSAIDTLKYAYNHSLMAFNESLAHLSRQEKLAEEAKLTAQKQNVEDYVKSVKMKASEEEHRVTQGVLSQVNAYAKEFAESKGLDLIMGTSDDGNVLHGSANLDVTTEMLAVLNARYRQSMPSRESTGQETSSK